MNLVQFIFCVVTFINLQISVFHSLFPAAFYCAAIDRAIEIDPDDSASWHVLAKWNVGIAKLGWMQVRRALALTIQAPIPVLHANMIMLNIRIRLPHRNLFTSPRKARQIAIEAYDKGEPKGGRGRGLHPFTLSLLPSLR
jgi:hypothetical protein